MTLSTSYIVQSTTLLSFIATAQNNNTNNNTNSTRGCMYITVTSPHWFEPFSRFPFPASDFHISLIRLKTYMGALGSQAPVGALSDNSMSTFTSSCVTSVSSKCFCTCVVLVASTISTITKCHSI